MAVHDGKVRVRGPVARRLYGQVAAAGPHAVSCYSPNASRMNSGHARAALWISAL